MHDAVSRIVGEMDKKKSKRLKAVWKRLRLSLASPSFSSSFRKAIIDLYEAPDFNTTEHVYNAQVDNVWSPRQSELFVNDEKDIKELCTASATLIAELTRNQRS